MSIVLAMPERRDVWLAAVSGLGEAEYFVAPNLFGVAHPNRVLSGLELGKLGHVDTVSPAEANDFPHILVSRKAIENEEHFPTDAVTLPNERHPIDPSEERLLISFVVEQDIGRDKLGLLFRHALCWQSGDGFATSATGRFRPGRIPAR